MSRLLHVAPAAWFLIAAATLLTVLTLLHFHAQPRFVADGGPAVPLSDETLVLSGSDNARPARAEFLVPLQGVRYFRVSARLAARDIARADRVWKQGRVIAGQVDRWDRLRLDYPHVVARLRGTRAAGTYAETFRVENETAAVLLRAEVLGTSGTLIVRDLRLQRLAEMPGFAAGTRFLGGCWILLTLATALRFVAALRRRRPAFRALAVVLAATTLCLSLLPVSMTAPLKLHVHRVLDWLQHAILPPSDSSSDASVPATLPSVPDATPDAVSGAIHAVNGPAAAVQAALSQDLFSLAKAGHVVMFVGIGLSFVLAAGRGRRGRWLLAALAMGGIAEMLQSFSPNRTPTLFDLVLNSASVLAGALVAVLCLFLWAAGRAGRRVPGRNVR